MLRRTIWIVLVTILAFLQGCQSGVEPGIRDGNLPAAEPESTPAALPAEGSTSGPTPLSSPSSATVTANSPATVTTGPTVALRPPATATSRPPATETPAKVPATATSDLGATRPEEPVTSSTCGDGAAIRQSRVYWGQESPPIPSPGGEWMAQTFNPDGDATIAVSRAGSADVVVIDAPHKGLPLGLPFWSPAASAGGVPRIAFANVALSQPGGGSIYVVGADGRDLTHVADYAGYHDDLAWSPDGEWIAYTSAATVSGSGSGMQVRDYQVMVVPANGSAEPVVVGPGCNPRWPADAPEIVAFQVTPQDAEPGDIVSLSWQARGDSATLCPSARYTLFTADDCWQAPVSGFTTFLIPEGTAGFQTVDFILEVEASGAPATAIGQATVALSCERTWFFSDDPQAGICPLQPVRTEAAAQHFERGLMIWLREPGRYYVLENAPAVAGDESRKKADVLVDPLEIVRDTSAGVEAPAGFYAPESGFGLVWRGDVAQSPGYRDRLGWALAPEFGYEAIWQCDDARPSGGQSWQTCYLLGPDGAVILLHPLGGWELLTE